jgi:hypothetical protein
MKLSHKAPLTLEDVRIWSDVADRGYRRHGLLFASRLVNPDSDERDADLMLHAQRHKMVAALQRTDDRSRIDLRQSSGIDVSHLGLFLPSR